MYQEVNHVSYKTTDSTLVHNDKHRIQKYREGENLGSAATICDLSNASTILKMAMNTSSIRQILIDQLHRDG